MTKNRPLVLAACATLFVMGVLPLTEAFISTLPTRGGTAAWRYGTVGVMADALTLPLAALVFSVGLALVLEWRLPMRVLAVVAGVGALAALVVLPWFLLDAVQLRASLRQDLYRSFDVATGSAAFKLAAAAVLGGMVARGGWKSAARSARRRPDGGAMLVGRHPGGAPVRGDAHDEDRPGT